MSHRSKESERRVTLHADESGSSTERRTSLTADVDDLQPADLERRQSFCGIENRRPIVGSITDAHDNLRRSKFVTKRVTLEAGLLAAELGSVEAWVTAAQHNREALLRELHDLRAVMRADADQHRVELKASVDWVEQQNADELSRLRAANAALRGKMAAYTAQAYTTEHAEQFARERSEAEEAEVAERELRLTHTRQGAYERQQNATIRRLTNGAATLRRERDEARRGCEEAEVRVVKVEGQAREAEALGRELADQITKLKAQLEQLRLQLAEAVMREEQFKEELDESLDKVQLLKLASCTDDRCQLPTPPEQAKSRRGRQGRHGLGGEDNQRHGLLAPPAPSAPSLLADDAVVATVAELRAEVGDLKLQAQLHTLNEQHKKQRAAQAEHQATVERLTTDRDALAKKALEQAGTIKALRAEVQQEKRERQRVERRSEPPPTEEVLAAEARSAAKAQHRRQQAEMRTQMQERLRLSASVNDLKTRLDLMTTRCDMSERGRQDVIAELASTQVALGVTVAAMQAKEAQCEEIHKSLLHANIRAEDARAAAAAAAASLGASQRALGSEVASLECYIFGHPPPYPTSLLGSRQRSHSPKRQAPPPPPAMPPLRHHSSPPSPTRSGSRGSTADLPIAWEVVRGRGGVQEELQWCRVEMAARCKAQQELLQECRVLERQVARAQAALAAERREHEGAKATVAKLGVEAAELRKRMSKMRLHTGKGTARGYAIERDTEHHGRDEGLREVLAKVREQLQIKDRRCHQLEAAVSKAGDIKTKMESEMASRIATISSLRGEIATLTPQALAAEGIPALRHQLEAAQAGWHEALAATSLALQAGRLQQRQHCAILAAEMLAMDSQLATLRERLVAAADRKGGNAADRMSAASERKVASTMASTSTAGLACSSPGGICSLPCGGERRRWGVSVPSCGPHGPAASSGGGGAGGVLRATRGAEAPTTIASDLARSH